MAGQRHAGNIAGHTTSRDVCDDKDSARRVGKDFIEESQHRRVGRGLISAVAVAIGIDDRCGHVEIVSAAMRGRPANLLGESKAEIHRGV